MNVEQLIGNLAEISGAIADNRGNVEKLIADAALTMENLRQATGDLESMAASLQTNVETLTTRADDTLVAFESMASSTDREITVTSKDARELIASLQQTAGNLDGATERSEEHTCELQTLMSI